MSSEIIGLNQGNSITQMLNNVSYAHDPNYVPTQFAVEFVNFIKLVNGSEGEENKTPTLHYRMLDTFVSPATRIANMLFRGSGKTTVFGEYMFPYLAIYEDLPGFGKIDFAIYVSDSMENGVKNLRKNMEYRWESSEFLQTYIPKIKFTDNRWEFTNLDGHTLIVKGYGAKSGVRGSKAKAKRPTFALLDDLVSDEDARSETVISAIEDTVGKAVNHAMHPTHKKLVWNGTPYNARDPLYKAITSGAWEANVYPVCEQYPCDKKDFRSAWPDRFPYEFVKNEYEVAKLEGKISSFNQELMLKIMSEEERLIRDNDIMWYSRDALLHNKSNFNFYITTDFATTNKDSGDYSVISVWAVNSKKDFFWVDGIVKKQTMNKNINDLFRLVQMYNPLSVGIEVSGQQKGFISIIQDMMLDRNIFFNLASDSNTSEPGIRPVANKWNRFSVVVPWFKAHKMFLPKELKSSLPMLEAYNELSLATEGAFKSKHDDWIDTVSMLPLINVALPSLESSGTLVQNESTGVWELEDDNEDASALSSYIT